MEKVRSMDEKSEVYIPIFNICKIPWRVGVRKQSAPLCNFPFFFFFCQFFHTPSYSLNTPNPMKKIKILLMKNSFFWISIGMVLQYRTRYGISVPYPCCFKINKYDFLVLNRYDTLSYLLILNHKYDTKILNQFNTKIPCMLILKQHRYGTLVSNLKKYKKE